MNSKIKSLLLPFYFGSIADSERTLVERELLLDTEILLDYLDLKRNIESAEVIPEGPSRALFSRLQRQILVKKNFILPFSFGAAIAACALVGFFVFQTETIDIKNTDSTRQEILFDSRHELSANSSVL